MDGGRIVEQEEEILEQVSNYYKNLFTSSAGNRTEELLLSVPPKVTAVMNSSLLRPFTEEEVKAGLDAIGDLKSLGADGMFSLFYKKHWHIVGEDVTREVLQFLNGGNMPCKWNDTTVVLIPKVQNPDKLKDLRPISLCNVIYKVAAKVLSNRLKLILPDIISQNRVHLFPGD